MNVSVYPSNGSFGEFADLPPVLIAASSDETRARAVIGAEAGGFRTVAFSIEDAIERLDLQARTSALWVEVDREQGSLLDLLLDRIDADLKAGHFPAIVCCPLPLVDRIMAQVQHPSVELLVDPSPVERVAALALAVAARSTGQRLHDISSEPGAARLRQLSDEVSRIAATLARLSTGLGAASVQKPAPMTDEAPAVSLDVVRQVIRARRLRARFFDEEIFADPAWDMLLDLLQAESRSTASRSPRSALPRPYRRQPRSAGSRP